MYYFKINVLFFYSRLIVSHPSILITYVTTTLSSPCVWEYHLAIPMNVWKPPRVPSPSIITHTHTVHRHHRVQSDTSGAAPFKVRDKVSGKWSDADYHGDWYDGTIQSIDCVTKTIHIVVTRIRNYPGQMFRFSFFFRIGFLL